MVRFQESSQGGVLGNRVIGLRLEILCFSSFVSSVAFDLPLSLRSRCLVSKANAMLLGWSEGSLNCKCFFWFSIVTASVATWALLRRSNIAWRLIFALLQFSAVVYNAQYGNMECEKRE